MSNKKGKDLKWGGNIYKISKNDILGHSRSDKGTTFQGPVNGHYYAVDAEEITSIQYADPETREVIMVNGKYEVTAEAELGSENADALYTSEEEAQAIAKSLNDAEWKRWKVIVDDGGEVLRLLEDVMNLKLSTK